MAVIDLNVQPRSQIGKEANHKLRVRGVSPGIFYGPKAKPTPVTFQEAELIKALRGQVWSATLFKLASPDTTINGKVVFLKDWELHPVTRKMLHADFLEVDLAQKIEVRIPLRFVGKAKGVAEGGILAPIQREIKIRVKPLEIPTAIDVDVTEVDEMNSLHFSDIKLPAGADLVSAPGDTVVTVTKIEEEVEKPVAVAADAAAGATPAAGAPAAGGADAGKAAAPAAGAKAAPAAGGDKAPAKK